MLNMLTAHTARRSFSVQSRYSVVASRRSPPIDKEQSHGGGPSRVGHREGPAALLPIMAVVSLAFLVIGLALPVLPLHVHQGLGLGTFVVGLITGSQFAASVLSRVWSG